MRKDYQRFVELVKKARELGRQRRQMWRSIRHAAGRPPRNRPAVGPVAAVRAIALLRAPAGGATGPGSVDGCCPRT